ncbi:hypothetical protein X729_31020 [Mesorhizobium sp. L103C131B0]|nr:hypothetical protein X729_31020 [Mesorhizobium sp. L103C131B0]
MAIHNSKSSAEAMERHGLLRFTAEIRTRFLTMSAATIDRVLANVGKIEKLTPDERKN